MGDTEKNKEGTGPMRGSDNKPSLRRWLAVGSFGLSAVLSVVGLLKMTEVNALGFIHLLYISPAFLWAFIGLLLIGMITWQNVSTIVSSIKK